MIVKGLGWLEFSSSFSTKRLYRALQKLKFVKQFFFSFRKLKDILHRGIDENERAKNVGNSFL